MNSEKKAQLLKDMDKYLRSNIQDEDLFYGIWCVYMPDGATDSDFMEIAEDEDQEIYNDCMQAFAKCVISDNK